MNNHDLIIIILIIILVLCFLKYSMNCKNTETFKNKGINNRNEKFQNTNKGKIESIKTNSLLDIDKKLFTLEDGSYIYNKLSVNIENKTPLEAIVINTSEKDELGNIIQQNKLYNKYPINIIYYPILINDFKYRYIYIAIFNDGALYTKNSLTDNNWEGPQRNSYYYNNNTETYIPMRNLAISNEGRILGVGYDGNIYIKEKEDTDIENLYNKNYGDVYKNEWVKYHSFGMDFNIIYIMLLNDTNFDEQNTLITNKQDEDIYYLGINNNGDLNLLLYKDLNSNKLKEQNKLIIKNKIVGNNKLYKINLDNEGHLLLINQSRELMRTSSSLKVILNTNRLQFDSLKQNDKDNYKNPNILYDIIQSQDGKLYGIGSINKKVLLLKQSNIHFLHPFNKIDDNLEKEGTNIIPKKYIVKYKNNYNIKEISKVKIKTLEESYDKEINEDNQKFKKFCSAQFPNNYINIEMLNKIDEYQDKIENLKKVKEDLINIDNLPNIQ